MHPSRSRRRARAVIVSALLAATAIPPAPGALAATASPASCAAPGYQTFGPASLTGAIVGATVHDGKAYVVTRGLKPPLLAEIDLATNKVVREVRLPDAPAAGEAEGAWATTVSGGKIYIGTYPVPDLYSFDPATGEVQHLRSFGRNGGFVWSLATAPDGTLYAGTYPDGRVWEYVPSTGAVRDFGVLAAGERYVRAVAADADNVYAGLLDKGKLMAIRRSDGAVRQLAQGPAGIGAVAEHGDRVLAASGTTLLDVRKDGTDPRSVDLGGVTLDTIAFGADGTAYLASRPNGTVYRYRTGDSAPTELGTPRLGEETRRLVPDGDRLTGFSGSGGMWTMDLTTKAVTYTDLIEAGLTTGSERPQSILLDHGRRALYIGGHYAVTVRDLSTGAQRRLWVPGEPKAMVRRGDKVYAAIYPSGQIIELDPGTGRIRSLGYLGQGQQRPWDLEYDPRTDKLLVATAPLGANLKGALSVVDPDTGDKQVYVDVIPDQSLMSLSLDSANGVVYLGGDVLGGGGTPPTKTSASVAAFDLATRKVLWQVDPVQGYRTFQDIKVHNGVLYGVYKRNASWFAMDLATRTITHQGALPGYGEIEVHRGRVFASTYFGGGNVYALHTEAKLLATGLGDEWYTNPQLAFEPGSWNAWALIGRDLARIRLDPRCPALTVPAAVTP
ncbi:outer membrane protein assembly factor BamB family protein [Actinomadura fibrosa]|uniref:PQQ-binding-like beta-propeller repeat protein n=1 Tax=Actinomadura fibrosa TaxID=111802 RepID=A0ABW2XTQ8_9ACTN|nr:PQQ-binding-like beta-propeller repeat protein [Actinomadura fibrosa]